MSGQASNQSVHNGMVTQDGAHALLDSHIAKAKIQMVWASQAVFCFVHQHSLEIIHSATLLNIMSKWARPRIRAVVDPSTTSWDKELLKVAKRSDQQ
ncbi:hypothetical protein MKX08_003558 [Trichoderma sp. CBMAI-0020]|nr:hypothetical protein MKX08_003558 [Trichoderma sp. CBMAI-0020]